MGTSPDPNNGDRDATVVIFFEIPDGSPGSGGTPPATIYFGINDPANTGATTYDQSGAENNYWYLIGGTGALSDPSSQLLTYNPYPSTQPLAGTLLDSFVETGASADTGWKYFKGDSPSQGEHIGNKYYFKVVLQEDNAGANPGKNAFQADVSTASSGAPTEPDGALSFAYDWSPFLSSTGGVANTYNLYPFVTSTATGNITSHTWDIDNGVTGTKYNISGTNLGSVAIGGVSAEGVGSFSVTGQTNATWHLNCAGIAGTTADDLTEAWFTNGTTNLRSYSSFVGPQTADHITPTYNGSTLPTGGSGQVTIQVVSSSGVPALISENVWVTVGGSAQITIVGSISDMAAAPNALPESTHRISDLGLGLPGQGIVEPIWAKDQSQVDPLRRGAGIIHAFDGSGSLQAQTITVQGYITDADTSATDPLASLSLSVYFDSGVSSSVMAGSLWLPPFTTTQYNGLVPYSDTAAHSVSAIADTPNVHIRDAVISSSDSLIKSGNTIEFFYEIAGANPLICADLSNPSASNWYRLVQPWAFKLQNIVTQRGEVTILHNVINPNYGEHTNLEYTLTQGGMVTINVFDLAGDLVNTLYSGQRSPGVDEFRKVLVVK